MKHLICIPILVVCVVSLAAAQVGGSGTTNFVPLWTSPTTLGNSIIFQTNTNMLGVGIKNPVAKLDVFTVSNTGAALRAHNLDFSSNSTDHPIGVLGITDAAFGTGVFGHEKSALLTGPNQPTGVTGQADASSGIGVLGIATATTGNATGVIGQTSSATGAGVFGYSKVGAGVAAQTDSPSGTALGATATATTGTPLGVFASVKTTQGIPAYFLNQANGNIIVGAASSGFVFRVNGAGKVFADGGFQSNGADFAESVAIVQGRNEPGDLLAVDTSATRRLTLATEPYSTLVAGIYSTKPGVLASPHGINDTTPNEIPLAIVGIVPCKVSAENGSIHSGDLLVSSSTPGYAMKGTDRSRMLGAVVGKALEPLVQGKGVIQVLVTLQ